jgi:hypothetical protein
MNVTKKDFHLFLKNPFVGYRVQKTPQAKYLSDFVFDRINLKICCVGDRIPPVQTSTTPEAATPSSSRTLKILFYLFPMRRQVMERFHVKGAYFTLLQDK